LQKKRGYGKGADQGNDLKPNRPSDAGDAGRCADKNRAIGRRGNRNGKTGEKRGTGRHTESDSSPRDIRTLPFEKEGHLNNDEFACDPAQGKEKPKVRERHKSEKRKGNAG